MNGDLSDHTNQGNNGAIIDSPRLTLAKGQTRFGSAYRGDVQ